MFGAGIVELFYVIAVLRGRKVIESAQHEDGSKVGATWVDFARKFL